MTAYARQYAAGLEARVKELESQRDIAIDMLAQWVTWSKHFDAARATLNPEPAPAGKQL